jgi:hypothetical protein
VETDWPLSSFAFSPIITKGKSYVIFGKKDSTVIELSAIASGTGGFVMNGENAGFSPLITNPPVSMADRLSNTAIELSAIASGNATGGFVINGENANDISGISVSNAGDVNGDGMDDLIVGATHVDPDSQSKFG